MELERPITLYDEPSIHSVKPLSTIDRSQIGMSNLEQQLKTPIFDTWLSDDLPCRNGLTTSSSQLQVNPVVPLVVEQKAVEEDERDVRLSTGRRRGATITTPVSVSFTSHSSSSRQSVSRPPYIAFNSAVFDGQTTSDDSVQAATFIPLSVCIPKDDPQTVPCFADERKLEKKRERNRIAAQRCRQRKVEQINMLQERVESLNRTKVELERTADDLRRQVDMLRRHIHQHVNAGCQIAHRTLHPPSACSL